MWPTLLSALALLAWSWSQVGRESTLGLWVKLALLLTFFSTAWQLPTVGHSFAERSLLGAILILLYLCLAEWLPRWRAPRRQDEEDEVRDVGLPLQDATRELLAQVLELGSLRAGALRRPLHRVPQLAASMSLARARRELVEQKAAWAAVLDDAGQVCGLLDFTRLPRAKTVGAAMRHVPILPELAPVAAGVPLLWERSAPFVLLVDEYGQGTGIIERGRWADTLLDRMPESQDNSAWPAVLRLNDAAYLLDANLPLHEFRDRFGAPGVGDERTETILGFAEQRLGRLLCQDDAFGVFGDEANFDFKVVRTDQDRPARFELTVHPASSEQTA